MNYYDQRLLALEDLIYKNESTDIYKKTEKNYRLSVEEAKILKKAYMTNLIKSTADWHLVFLNDFISYGGFIRLTLSDYARLLYKGGYKTKTGGIIKGNSISVYITEIRSRYGLLCLKEPSIKKSYKDKVRMYSLKEWDSVLSKVYNLEFIVSVYRVHLWGWDVDYIEKIGKDKFKTFLCRSLGILNKYYPKKNAKIEK